MKIETNTIESISVEAKIQSAPDKDTKESVTNTKTNTIESVTNKVTCTTKHEANTMGSISSEGKIQSASVLSPCSHSLSVQQNPKHCNLMKNSWTQNWKFLVAVFRILILIVPNISEVSERRAV